MEILDAEYQYDRHKLTFFFEAERRIDFRELVSELFSQYKTRIWMQQVDTSSLCIHDPGIELAQATGFLPPHSTANYTYVQSPIRSSDYNTTPYHGSSGIENCGSAHSMGGSVFSSPFSTPTHNQRPQQPQTHTPYSSNNTPYSSNLSGQAPISPQYHQQGQHSPANFSVNRSSPVPGNSPSLRNSPSPFAFPDFAKESASSFVNNSHHSSTHSISKNNNSNFSSTTNINVMTAPSPSSVVAVAKEDANLAMTSFESSMAPLFESSSLWNYGI
jgi:hypothetical protein